MTALPGLYIHIPFCIRKCAYCGFYSVTDLTRIPDFLAALRREMNLNKGVYREFDTVYIGGGTPSVLAAADLERLIGDIRTAFTITSDAEITLEANPGDITAGLLATLRRAGVNRLNIGCQSFDDETLAFLGRRHQSRQALEAIRLARDAGFDNLGIDLIYGLPGPSGNAFAVWLDTLRTTLSLHPEHLSCYQLTVEADTPLAALRQEGRIIFPDDDLQAQYFFRTAEILEEAGYRHYEVSNFARGDRFHSRHNSKYWDHSPYLGLGPAAHSFDGRQRRWNHRSLDSLSAGSRRRKTADRRLRDPDRRTAATGGPLPRFSDPAGDSSGGLQKAIWSGSADGKGGNSEKADGRQSGGDPGRFSDADTRGDGRRRQPGPDLNRSSGKKP